MLVNKKESKLFIILLSPVCFSAEADNTDDENGETQVSMETKERSRAPQAQAIRSQFSGTSHFVPSHFAQNKYVFCINGNFV